MPQALTELRRGTVAVVVPGGLLHDGPQTTVRRLRHQGIVAGTELTVVRRTAGGGRIVAVGRSRIALDPGVAAGLLVDTGLLSDTGMLNDTKMVADG